MAEIRSDIPIPESHKAKRFPELLDLKVGDSVWYENISPQTLNNQSYRVNGRRYTQRTWSRNGTPDQPVLEGDDIGRRVWRIK